MPYPKRRLNDDERVVLDMHPHPFYMFGPVALLIAAIAASVLSVALLDGTAERAANNAVIVTILIGLVWLCVRYVRWRNTFFVVTSRRVISQSGVLTRGGIEIPIERVNNVGFRQSLIERLIGVGDIEIESGAEDGKQEFTDVRDPGAVKHVITTQIQASRRSYVQGPSIAASEVTSQLERLEAMLERGTLTWNEFETQKHRLIAEPDER